jgi:aspartokinase-like uncharacterized kinase
MQVVKIGGSLYDTPELKKWLKQLAKAAKDDSIIIVPGGGPFADTVRDAQKKWRFDNQQAHHMALLAMAQYGILMHGLQQQSTLFYFQPSSPHPTGLNIWIPNEELLKQSSIAQNWDVTSDSLALWLSQQLTAKQLCLIKRVRPRTNSIRQLTESNLLDKEFGPLFAQQPVESYIHYYQDLAGFDLSKQYAKRLVT